MGSSAIPSGLQRAAGLGLLPHKSGSYRAGEAEGIAKNCKDSGRS